jgi:sec-independent protein translocase protein TatB
VFNVTGGELVIILLVALIVLGPEKLPEAIRKFGRVYGELRRMSSGFQSELRDALDEPLREARDTMNTVKSGFLFGEGDTPTTDGATDEPTGPPNSTADNGDNGTNGTAPIALTDATDGATDEPVGPSDPD